MHHSGGMNVRFEKALSAECGHHERPGRSSGEGATLKTLTIGRGYRNYERYEVTLPGSAITAKVERDVLLSGLVVGIVPMDVVKGEVVLIRQFRLSGHIALDKGAMIEVPAWPGVSDGKRL
jgi:hypothetical protein